MTLLADIDARSRAVFKSLVETYLETGQPVGSRTLARATGLDVSPATIRNVMADLTELGLLGAPHVSAGRLPTERGLRLFVDGLMEVGAPSAEERRALEDRHDENASVADLLDRAAGQLSGLTRSASLVLVDKADRPMRHVSFVGLDARRALMVLVDAKGDVENRLIVMPEGLPTTALEQAANFLNTHLTGRTVAEAAKSIAADLETRAGEIDVLAAELARKGIADLAEGPRGGTQLIVKGQATLLEEAASDLSRISALFEDLERKQGLVDILAAAREGEGVRIFIGSENPLFSLSGSSVVAAPYRDGDRNIVGVIGVIGPTRLNYARIIPLVDYTAEVVGRLVR